eukprot:NODE_1754_length_554_cov_150.480278_g1740_i0.p1 GENE.NODE_1754_length_554_cov_150.480278_g1740_i0~~NODE_1754_length_554_cov_150.480278_g1740_i0.p1  ORF type:complete len:142 (-),score=37.14 NODE_1754_length_554_cov_150.480278_g1740_i0:128-523(-)
MVKVLKPGKIVIVLAGHNAGKKGVIVSNSEKGAQDRAYGQCLVAGIQRYPKKTNRAMSQKKVARRTRVKAFLKMYNHNHVMATRYNMDLQDLHGVTSDQTKKKESKTKVKTAFQDRFKQGKNPWFFQALRF